MGHPAKPARLSPCAAESRLRRRLFIQEMGPRVSGQSEGDRLPGRVAVHS